MAKFIRAAEGYLLHRDGDTYPVPDGAEVVEFDEAANPELIDALCGRNPDVQWQDIAIEGGQIVIKKQPATINAPAEQEPTTLEEALAWIKTFRAAMQTATTLDELKIEDQKHPPLPEKETASASDQRV